MRTRHVLTAAAVCFALATPAAAQVTKYVRYESAGRVSYGLLEGDTVRDTTTSCCRRA